jgi:hypothetical protein
MVNGNHLNLLIGANSMAKVTEKLVTPIGELNWVFITDQGKKDLNGNDRFVASVRFHKDSAEFKAVQKQINDFWNANKPKGAKLKSNGIQVVKEKTDEVDSEGDAVYEETEMRDISFWTGTTFPNGNAKVIKTHNSRGSEVSLGSKKIGNGSIGAISGVMDIYDQGVAARGVTLYLNAILIKKLVEYTGGDAGFEDVSEDGDFDGTEDDFGNEPVEGSAKPRL